MPLPLLLPPRDLLVLDLRDVRRDAGAACLPDAVPVGAPGAPLSLYAVLLPELFAGAREQAAAGRACVPPVPFWYPLAYRDAATGNSAGEVDAPCPEVLLRVTVGPPAESTQTQPQAQAVPHPPAKARKDKTAAVVADVDGTPAATPFGAPAAGAAVPNPLAAALLHSGVPVTALTAAAAAAPAATAPSLSSASSMSAMSAAGASPSSLLPTSPTLRLCVLTHHHTVYCDRKRQVCTAEGAVREGNRLALALPAATSAPRAAAVTWYRSKEPMYTFRAMHDRLAHAAAGSVDESLSTAPDSSATGAAAGEDLLPLPAGHPDRYMDAASGVEMVACRRPRVLSSVFKPPRRPGLVVPEDADPAAAYSALETLLAHPASESWQNTDSPLYSAAQALRMMRNEAILALRDPLQYYLALADVGYFVSAVVTLPGDGPSAGPKTVPAVGPVQPAPPRIREMWLDGQPQTGGVLFAHCFYYGGVPGACEVSWIRVDNDGNRSESTPATADLLQPFPSMEELRQLWAEGKTCTDPRVLRITDQDIGCMYKAQCEPVRLDGERGAPSTSKPTSEVEQASS
jgi:hypothetical protein